MDLKQLFSERLRTACDKSRELGYTPIRFEQMLDRYGGHETAKRLIKSGDLQDGLKHLATLGRIDLSMESIMLEPEFQALFSRDELAAAKWRLQQL